MERLVKFYRLSKDAAGRERYEEAQFKRAEVT
jgi:hypothetical protein